MTELFHYRHPAATSAISLESDRFFEEKKAQQRQEKIEAVAKLAISLAHLKKSFSLPTESTTGSLREQENVFLGELLEYFIYLGEDHAELASFVDEFPDEAVDVLLKMIVAWPLVFFSLADNIVVAREQLLEIAEMIEVTDRVRIIGAKKQAQYEAATKRFQQEQAAREEQKRRQPLLKLVKTSFVWVFGDSQKKSHQEYNDREMPSAETLREVLELVGLTSAQERVRMAAELRDRFGFSANEQLVIIKYFGKLTQVVSEFIQFKRAIPWETFQDILFHQQEACRIIEGRPEAPKIITLPKVVTHVATMREAAAD